MLFFFVTSEEKKQLEILANQNDSVIDYSYDGDRRLGLFRLTKHPRRTSKERVTERLRGLLDGKDEAVAIEEAVQRESISDFVGIDTEEEQRLIFSLVSKIKIASDRSKNLNVDEKEYKKRVLNMWVREIKQKLSENLSCL